MATSARLDELIDKAEKADEAVTGTLLAKMADVEAAKRTVHLKAAAQNLIAALRAAVPQETGGARAELIAKLTCDHRYWKWHSTTRNICRDCGLVMQDGDQTEAMLALLPEAAAALRQSDAPPAPASTAGERAQEPLCRRCGLPESEGHEFGFRDHAFRAPDDCLTCDGYGIVWDKEKNLSHDCIDCDGFGKAKPIATRPATRPTPPHFVTGMSEAKATPPVTETPPAPTAPDTR